MIIMNKSKLQERYDYLIHEKRLHNLNSLGDSELARLKRILGK